MKICVDPLLVKENWHILRKGDVLVLIVSADLLPVALKLFGGESVVVEDKS